MLRVGAVALVLVALAHSAPTLTQDKQPKPRQWQIGDPYTSTAGWGGVTPTAIPSSGPGVLPPITGGLNPPPPRRQDNGPAVGRGDINALKAHLIALELEYERLVQQYGKSPPPSIAQRIKDIENELKKYGITIVQTPDGTSTIIVPGKTRKRSTSGLDDAYGDAAFNLIGLETTLEGLWHVYGPSPPHDIYIVEEKIKHILIAYGISIVQSPDGTLTTISPSTKRSASSYDLEKLSQILEIFVQEHNNERLPLADWLVAQHIAAVLKSYGSHTEQLVHDTTTRFKRNDKRGGTLAVGDGVNIVALQALLAVLEATYGSTPPRDILLIEQTIVTILSTQGITIPGFTIPGGSITPDPTIPGGGLNPDPTIPGGTITPDPGVPGGSLEPSSRRSTPDFDVEGLQAALAQLEAQYGTYGSGTVPVSVFIIMQNIVTILQAEGVTVPGWPNLGGGSTTIGPSD